MKLDINGKTFEVTDEILSKAIEDKTESIKIESDLIMRTPDEENTFVANTKKSGDSASFEIARKGVLKGLGIDVDGQHKSDESALTAINSFVQNKVEKALTDAKIEPDKQVLELKADKEGLIKNMGILQGQFDTFKTDTKKTQQSHKRDSTLSSLIPENTLNTKVNTLTILSASLRTGFDENGVMHGIGEDGQPMKDNTMTNLPIKDVVGKFFESHPELLKDSSGGAGGGDSGGGEGKKTFDQFIKEQTTAGNALNDAKFVENMTAEIKAGTLDI